MLYKTLHQAIEENNSCPVCVSRGELRGWRLKNITNELEIIYICNVHDEWRIFIDREKICG